MGSSEVYLSPWTEDVNRDFTLLGYVRETHSAYIINYYLPGLRKKDLHIVVNEGIIFIEGRRVNWFTSLFGKKDSIEATFIDEFFDLPYDVDESNIKANLHDNELRIVIKKLLSPSHSRHINIEGKESATRENLFTRVFNKLKSIF